MRVFVIRHGESIANKNKVWTGWSDVPLTDKGIEDAKKAGEFLKGFSFDKVYSSDLQRAIQTANAAIGENAPETSELLREINVGSLVDKPLSVLDPEQKAIVSSEGYLGFGGESKADFKCRLLDFIGKLEAEDCENVAVFTHAGWLRTFLDTVVGVYLPRNAILCNNCAVGIFEYVNESWKLHSWINLI